MGLQFGLTARFRYVTAPLGEDVLYHFHRQISQIAVGLVVAHALIMSVTRPEMFALPGAIGDVPWGAVFAFLSIFALIALIVTAVWRTNLKISYEAWHLSHIVWPSSRSRPGWCTWWVGLSIFPTRGSGRCGSA